MEPKSSEVLRWNVFVLDASCNTRTHTQFGVEDRQEEAEQLYTLCVEG